MQNDLISRSEAYQRMVEETEQSGKCHIELSTIGRLLNDVPTVYRPNKVEKQIKELSIREFGEIRTEDVLAIIRNGGKE